MTFLRDASIGAKLHALTATSVLVALVLACGAFAFRHLWDLRAAHVRQAETLAVVLGANTTAALEFGDRRTAEELLSSLRNESSIDLAVLYDAHGAPFAVYAKDGVKPAAIPPRPTQVGHAFTNAHLEVAHLVREEEAADERGSASNAEAPASQEARTNEPLGVLLLRANLDEIRYETWLHLAITAAVLAVSLTAAMVISSRVQRLIVAPVRELAAAARRITQKSDFSHRVERCSGDEHGALCDAFNAMLDHIETAQTELQEAHDQMEQRVVERTAQLQKAVEEATAASRAKSDFLANMSHEIRTPMTAVLGYADLLVEEERISPEGVERIETIRRNGRHLMSIINDILDVSKIEAGKMTVERIDCSVCRTLVDVVSLWRGRAIEKGLTLEVKYQGRIPERIRTDPTRLHQILANLLSNAIKFTNQGGINLIVSMIGPTPDGIARLQFEVIDTGVGMTPEQVEKVFQAFTQADETMTRRFGGTGLGLTIVKGLTHLLGGEIRVASELGKGTRFTLTIAAGPLEGVRMIANCREAMLTADRPAAGPPIQLGGRVLLVDDGKDNQSLISFHLRRAGAEVTVAENGQQGLEAALEAWQSGDPFRVVLMDMQMPVLDGYQATARLREAGYPLPVIALTAHAMSHDRQKCLDAGCNDYLSKPVDKQHLLAKVAEHAERTLQPT
jgi:signal transduction histidine kinase/ActR/RegA family two-component response regulator